MAVRLSPLRAGRRLQPPPPEQENPWYSFLFLKKKERKKPESKMLPACGAGKLAAICCRFSK
jgi:hypothetical protein